PVGSVATFRYLPVDLTAGFEVLDPTGITVTPGVPATRYGDTFGAFGATQYTFIAPATGLFAFRTANADTDSGANADASDTANAGFSPSVFLLTEIYGNDRYYDFERVRPEFGGTGIFLLEEGALFAVEAMGIPSQIFDIITMQVSDYVPNNVGLLHWPLDSMQVTMWYGQLDRLSPVISPGLNIQCDSASEVRALAAGVVVYSASDRAYISFRHSGTYMRAIYFNMASQVTVGQQVNRGEVIGHMLPHMDKYVLELILHTSEDAEPVGQSNSRRVNPAPFFDLSGIMDDLDFLSRPMANFFSRNAASDGIHATDDDARFAGNYDLVNDAVYLRRYFETLYYTLGGECAHESNVVVWNEDDGTITVNIFGITQLFIPYGMCELEAWENHLIRMQSGNFEPLSGFSPDSFEIHADSALYLDIAGLTGFPSFGPPLRYFFTGNNRAVIDGDDGAIEDGAYGVFIVGVEAAASIGIRGNVGYGVIFDRRGNWGIIDTVSVGQGTVDASVGIFIAIINAPTIHDAAGPSIELGVSTITPVQFYGIGLEVGIEVTVTVDDFQYGGFIFTTGIGTGAPLDVYFQLSYSVITDSETDIFIRRVLLGPSVA
ncbi:MAG: M23 family metallopeptidase, partial [Defluviitaleaceae bacterium]|nr:M23 family metallopeptidase [Defluviitaleaceae bacterium]